MPCSEFCNQCSGPYPLDAWPGNQYAGHWDTCPNRPKRARPKHGDRVTVPFGTKRVEAAVEYTRSDGRVVARVSIQGTDGISVSFSIDEIGPG